MVLTTGFSVITVLITLHVLGDFYLQTEKIAHNKTISYRGVIVHAIQYGIPFLLALLFIRLNVVLLVCLILPILSHLAVDSLKYWMSKKQYCNKYFEKPVVVFLVDQLLHIFLLMLIAVLYVKVSAPNPLLYLYGIWSDLLISINLEPGFAIKWLLLGLLIVKPANIIFNLFFSTFKPEEEATRDTRQQRAGAIIGTLERMLIVFFISINQFAALGFILTAKSIARYDAITKDRIFAEYYLIGTLVSVVFSVAAYALVFRRL